MKPLARRAALIFDMDGVLWDSDRIHEAAYRAVLEPLGVTVPAYSQLAGRRTDEVMRSLLDVVGVRTPEAKITALTTEKQSRAREMLRREPPLAPQCREVLAILHRRFRLALASSASRGSVGIFIEASQSSAYFEAVLCGEDVSAAKPSPEIYLLALQRLGLAASDAYVIEDSVSGVVAAAAAGMPVIGYRNRKLALGYPQVVDVIDSLEQLTSL
jgi:HAD superfamily hydrolase (TIGR01509 family)